MQGKQTLILQVFHNSSKIINEQELKPAIFLLAYRMVECYKRRIFFDMHAWDVRILRIPAGARRASERSVLKVRERASETSNEVVREKDEQSTLKTQKRRDPAT